MLEVYNKVEVTEMISCFPIIKAFIPNIYECLTPRICTFNIFHMYSLIYFTVPVNGHSSHMFQ